MVLVSVGRVVILSNREPSSNEKTATAGGLAVALADADELTEALIANPFDAEELATAIHEGQVMELAERRDRHASLLAKVRSTTAQRFCDLRVH